MIAKQRTVLIILLFNISLIATSETAVGVIPVPFKAQVPPGNWSTTKNCGQASALMVFCYYDRTSPDEQGIKNIDDWLYEKYGDPINDYDGSEVNITKLETLAKEYAGCSKSYKASGWNIARLKQEIDIGHPIIAAVVAGYLSNRGYPWTGEHFLVVNGYDDAHIICNDPGTSQGENKSYLNEEFSDALSAQGGSVVVTVPHVFESNSPWPMFLCDRKHTGRSPYRGPQTNKVCWTCRIREGVSLHDSPVVGSNDTIYVGGYSGGQSKFLAIKPDGTIKWSTDIYGGTTEGIPAIGSDGAICFTTSAGVNQNGLLYCLNPDGSIQWTGGHQLNNFYLVETGLTIGTDGIIYLTDTVGCALKAVNPDGTLKWSYGLGARSWSSPAIADDGTIYVGQDDHILYAVEPNGTEKWSIKLSDVASYRACSPAIGEDGTIYFGDWDRFYAISPTGGIKWSIELTAYAGSPAIGFDGTIYLGCYFEGQYHFVAIKPTGSIKWAFPVDGGIQSSPAIANDGTIYFGAEDHHVYALNSDGSLKWKYETGNLIIASPAITSSGLLVIPSGDGYLYAFGPDEFNSPPVADAGPNQTVYAWIDGVAEVTLDGSDSNDLGGDELTYLWSWVIDGNTYEANGVKPTIKLPVGVHTIQLIVGDGFVDSAPDDVNITVIAPLKSKLEIIPPIINRSSYSHRKQDDILAFVRIPEGITKKDIDNNEPLTLYPGGIKASKQWIIPIPCGYGKHKKWLTGILAFFDKDAVVNAIPTNGRVELKVAGKLKSGQYFYGCNTVKIVGWQQSCHSLKK